MSPDNKTISNDADIQTIVEIPQYGKKNVVLDATMLSTLMSCPRLSDFRFNMNLMGIGGKSNSLETGSIVHVFMEYYYKSIIAGVKKDDAFGYGISAAQMYIQGCPHCTDFHPIKCDVCVDGWVAIGDDIADGHVPCEKCDKTGWKLQSPGCGHKVNEFPGVKNTPKDNTKLQNGGSLIGWQWALDSCDQYHRHYRNDHWVPLEVEVVKSMVLYEDDEIRVMWKSKLDLISDTNQGIFPIDHKTMKQNRDTNSMNNQFMGQCRIMNTNNVFINKFGFQTTLKPEEKFKRINVPYSNSRLLEWQGTIVPYYAKLLLMYAEMEYYPPNFSNCEGKYGNCPFYKTACSLDPDDRERGLKNNFVVGPEWNPTNDED